MSTSKRSVIRRTPADPDLARCCHARNASFASLFSARSKRFSRLFGASLAALSLAAATLAHPAAASVSAAAPENQRLSQTTALTAPLSSTRVQSPSVELTTLQGSNALTSTTSLTKEAQLSTLSILGIPHTIRPDETLESIAQHYNIPLKDIVGFAPNGLVNKQLPVGKEIFIPGATPRLPGLQSIVRKEIERIGLVKADHSNFRPGPDPRHPRLGELNRGDHVRLVARYQNWYKVQLSDGNHAWMAAEALTVPGYVVVSLPVTTDFPPPPTWVQPTQGWLTSPFGWRDKPWRMFHNGIDIANAEGTEVVAVRDGTVTAAGWCPGYGYCVKIQHAEDFESIYGHLMTQPVVKVGDAVHANQPIGLLGNTFDASGGGYSTGPHLHFTLKHKGVPVDPFQFLP